MQFIGMSRIDLCGFISAAATAGWIQIDFSFCIDFFIFIVLLILFIFFFVGVCDAEAFERAPLKLCLLNHIDVHLVEHIGIVFRLAKAQAGNIDILRGQR